MAEHGGYRKPSNPAPVSGPGAHSARTDGQVASAAPDQSYGDQTQQMNDQKIAPLAAATPQPGPVAPDASQAAQMAPYSGGDFGAPSSQPHVPVTNGVPIGPGAGPNVIPTAGQKPTGAMTAMLQQLSASDTTGVLAQLYQNASDKGV